MKKIFRMALVFALAGATLMYTGCTKDYDEDINAANQKIESLVAQHAADVAALKNDLSTAVSNLEAAYKKADDAVTAAYKAADADLQKAIDANKAAIDANKTAIDANKAAIADANTAIAAIEEELKTFATKEELAAAEAGLEAKIKAVADDLAAVKTQLDKVAEDLGKQISDLDAKFTTALAEQKADLEGQIAQALLTAKNVLSTAKAELEAALALLGNELRSIVFEPELYYAGIEATTYTWTWVSPSTMYANNDFDVRADGEFDQASERREIIIFPKGTELFRTNSEKPSYTVGQIASANYSLNPSSFDVNKAEWALSGKDYEYLVRADEEEVWTPEFVTWDDNGAVRYTIANPNLLPTNIYGQGSYSYRYVESAQAALEAFLAENKIDAPASGFIGLGDLINWLLGGDSQAEINERFQEKLNTILESIADLKDKHEEDIETLQGDVKSLYSDLTIKAYQIAELYANVARLYNFHSYVPSMRLTATLSGEREVASDYAAIVSNPEWFEELGFSSESTYKTSYTCNVGSPLYYSIYDAVSYPASVPVAYDKTLDLNFVNIHMWDSYKGEYESTLADLKKVYPDLSMTYEIVNYIDGKYGTEEGKFGKIVDGVFYPQCVDAAGNQIDPKDAPNHGRSAVDKKPLVLVKLFNGDDLVLAGYFKIIIVQEISSETIDLDPFDTIPFICGTQSLYTTWAQFSAALESLGTTYKSFSEQFKIVYDAEYNASTTLPQNIGLYADVYEFVDGKFVRAYDEETGTYKYGQVIYWTDGFGNGVNNVFEVRVNDKQAKNIGTGKSKTIYVKFIKDLYNEVYVSFTISVAEPAKFDFGANKLNNEWFNDVEADVRNTVKLNVAVPNNPGEVIGSYYRNLDHFFVGEKPGINLTDDSDPVYSTLAEDGETLKYAYDIEPRYEYFFNAEQSCGLSTFVVSEDGKRLYAEDEVAENLVARISGNYLYYEKSDVAMELLNMFPNDTEKVEEMLWADIHVKVVYGTTCVIAAGEADFHARFLRPLNIEFAEQTVKEESQVNGANLYIKNFLKPIVDWNNQGVVVWNENKKQLEENIIKDKVNMYTYYGFQFLEIDLAKAVRNNWNINDPAEFGVMKDVTPSAQLRMGVADDNDFLISYYAPFVNHPPYNITSLANLDNQVINYRNEKANVDAFTIKIPVKVTYAWGTIEDVIVVDVQKTTETQPGK